MLASHWLSNHQQPACRGGAMHGVQTQIKPCRLTMAAASGNTTRGGASTLIKICGITNEDDAAMAAQAGADYIGMIMWPKAKRGVSDATAKLIADAAKAHGAQPVGVFVDEPAEVILDRCRRAGICIAQLHGDGARSSLPRLAGHLQVVYVLNCHADGTTQTSLPYSQHTAEASSGAAASNSSSSSSGISSSAHISGDSTTATGTAADTSAHPAVDWLLLDGLQGGSGQTFDWSNLTVPGHGRQGWLLAGGLQPGNVAEAVRLAKPTAVDVSSGVCGPDGLLKDRSKVAAFIQAVVGTHAQ